MVRILLLLSIAAISIAVQVLSVSHKVQASAQGHAQNRPIIRSTTRLINVNVVVTDRQGQPVRGLTKDDFQIFDNGHPEKIAFFSSGEDKTPANYTPRSLVPGEYNNDPHRLGLEAEGTTIILFDTVNSGYLSQAQGYLSQAYALGAIRIFLRQLQQEDRVGIYVLNENGLKVVYDPGQTVAALVEAMQRYDQAHHGGAGGKAITPTDNSTGSVELDRFLRGKEDRHPLPEWRCVEKGQLTIAAFQQIARSTIGLKGRKAVIWVTDDPPFSPYPQVEGNVLDQLRERGCGDFDPELILEEPANLKPQPGSRHSPFVPDRGLAGNDERDLLFRLFTQNDIVLYPVSAEGLQTLQIFGPGGAPILFGGLSNTGRGVGTGPVSTEGAISTLDRDSNIVSHQLMEDMARRTGGRAFFNRNNLETGIRRALDDGKYGYELAYYPDSDRWKGDSRKLQVKVNRSGVTVLSRSGYFAFSEPRLLPPKAIKQLLEEIAASPLEDTEIPITVKLARPSSATASTVDVRVSLSAQNLFTNHGDGWKSDFEVLFFQLKADNKILDVTTEPVSLELTGAKYTDALKEGIDTLAELQLKPGAALLYVIVHDKKSDAVGSVRIPLDQYASTLH